MARKLLSLSLVESRIMVEIALGDFLHIAALCLLSFCPILCYILTPITSPHQLLLAIHDIFNQLLPLQRVLPQFLPTLLDIIQDRGDVVLDLVEVCPVLAIIIIVRMPINGLVEGRSFSLQIIRIFRLTVQSSILVITCIHQIVDLP
jgi:hypothetical protein